MWPPRQCHKHALLCAAVCSCQNASCRVLERTYWQLSTTALYVAEVQSLLHLHLSQCFRDRPGSGRWWASFPVGSQLEDEQA